MLLILFSSSNDRCTCVCSKLVETNLLEQQKGCIALSSQLIVTLITMNIFVMEISISIYTLLSIISYSFCCLIASLFSVLLCLLHALMFWILICQSLLPEEFISFYWDDRCGWLLILTPYYLLYLCPVYFFKFLFICVWVLPILELIGLLMMT